jgi:hypothetical protein
MRGSYSRSEVPIMAKQFPALDSSHRAFIQAQKMFFTGSAAADGRVNISPKGLDSLRIIDDKTVAYMDLTGSGAETAAHLRATGRLTLMLCAFEGPPLILRLYGQGTSLPRGTAAYRAMLESAFDGREIPGVRQIVRLDVDMVQTSCGYAVPLYEYKEDRTQLVAWSEQASEAQLDAYRREHNTVSIDGFPTGLFSETDA